LDAVAVDALARGTYPGEARVRQSKVRDETSQSASGYRSAPMTLRTLALAALLLAMFCAPSAHAADDQTSIIMDDDLLLYRDANTAAKTLVAARSLGADAVRVTVLWRIVGEGAMLTDQEISRLKTDEQKSRARAQRARFRPADPRTYPTRNWDRYDTVVREATKLGMRVLFTITGPGPHYAHKTAPPSQRENAGTYKPYPSRFSSFVEAVGKRYTGSYRDENGLRRVPLPRVSLWSLWNEPNQPGWLTPQYEQRDGQVVPASPAIYRQLYVAGRQGLGRSGHGADPVLLGETSPLGSALRGPRNGIRPVPFLRELVCVAPNGTQYAGADAERRDCQDFAQTGPLTAAGYAHHPYTKKAAPTIAPAVPDEITIANIGSLGRLLDTLSMQSGAKIAAGLQIYLTEFGYESNPPDPRNGIPPMRQAQFNQLAEFLAYSDPRVKTTTQFLLRDAGPLTRFAKGSRFYWFTYQSGLLTLRGRAKPAAFSYALPFVVYKHPDPAQLSFWGQLRFRPNGAADDATIMWRPNATTPFQPVATVKTNFRGFFSGALTLPGLGGEYRAVYFNPMTGRITNSSLSATL